MSIPTSISTASGLVYRSGYKPAVTDEVNVARDKLTALRAAQEKSARDEFVKSSLANGSRKTHRVSSAQAANYATINEVAARAQRNRVNLDTAELNNADILGRVTELSRVLSLLSVATGIGFKSELVSNRLSTPAEISATILSATHLVREVTSELVGLQEVHRVAQGDLRGLLRSLATSSVTDEDLVSLAFPGPDPQDLELAQRIESLSDDGSAEREMVPSPESSGGLTADAPGGETDRSCV